MSVVRLETAVGVGTVTVHPPPNDGQRYILMWDFDTDAPRWQGGGGFGTTYGDHFGRAA
jgi:hypothetical protein